MSTYSEEARRKAIEDCRKNVPLRGRDGNRYGDYYELAIDLQCRVNELEGSNTRRFADDTTPLPCGCPTFYLYVRDANVFCGKCGDHYSHGNSSSLILPSISEASSK